MTLPSRNRSTAKWIAIAGLTMLLLLIGAGLAFNGVLSRIVRDRAIASLQEKFGGQVELKDLSVTVFPRFHLSGDGVVVRYHGRSDLPPLISIRTFSGDAGLIALLTGHIRQIRLAGLEIQVPPKSERSHEQKQSRALKTSFLIDTINADGAVLKICPQDPNKEPLVWEIRHLTLHDAGPTSPIPFHATLINAAPPGDIDTQGKFGPWQVEEPRATPVEGAYTFQNADLSVFKGISGILSSRGTYRGVLERIEVEGKTDTPDFALKVSGNPVHLTTQFHAVVDGTDGNTWLQPVNAQFGRSSVEARGSVTGTKDIKGKTISLDVVVQGSRLEDMLHLAVKGRDGTMTGAVNFRAKLLIPPGDIDVAQKMKLEGVFTAASAHFSNAGIQEKVNELSHRGEGDPKLPPTATVASDFAGRFKIDHGVVAFQDLSFRVPGVLIALGGTYGLTSDAMDFQGTAKLEAKLSQTTTGFKSFLLKAVDPFFEKKDAGAVVPIKITGTRENPSFGLEFKRAKR